MYMKRLIVPLSTIAISLFATTGFSAYKVYTNQSTSSKILTEINNKNSNQFFQFFTNKEKTWAKVANKKTGAVGWVDIKEIKKERADKLRNNMIGNINNSIQYHEQEIKDLNALKEKVRVANYTTLQKIQSPFESFGSSL